MKTETNTEIETLDAGVRKVLRTHGLDAPGNRIVVTAGLPLGVSGTTNRMRVLEIE